MRGGSGGGGGWGGDVFLMSKYGVIERNSVVPEVKIPFIVPVEILIKSHYVVTIQCILTTGRCIVQ